MLAQLVDLQFVGYRDIFKDIKNALCSYQSVKETSKELEPYGGLLGRILALEKKVEKLQEKVAELPDDTYKMIHGAIREYEDTHHISSQIFEKDLMDEKERVTALIRQEAVEVAEMVVQNRLQHLKIGFSY